MYYRVKLASDYDHEELSSRDLNPSKHLFEIIAVRYDSQGQAVALNSEFKMSSPKSPKSPKEFEFHNQSALRVTDEDIHQIELFFLSLKSRVFVCPALANLYFATLEDMASLGGWELQTTGFPTLILESGDLDGNRQGRLSLCIAEKGTGFILWKDVISKETGYKAPERNFHTMTVSEDKGKLAGLSFDDEGSAINFYHKVQTWIEEDFALRHSEYKKKGKKNKDKKKKLPKQKLPRKETISLPCCFEHVTKLDHEGYIQRAMGGLNSPEFFTQSADHSRSCDRTEFSARSLPGDVQSSPKREIISLKGDGGNGSHYAGSVAGFSESTTGSNDDSGLDEI
ncbi:hypothetical protein HOLleu_26072 [Holothuria leucospilota]|uniref:WH1 domain-containing protein n=1 Tax=Holothuria leucospilota TaxID=206669 RepID=A0A9Q1H4Z1_HOLLE|nr:hypothetical protein HOLleu_26072 [Holothuria leucospilota]